MKYIKQIGISIIISFIGELLNFFIPLPVPAGIYGIIILFIGLITKLIPLDCVKDVGHFLVEIMPIMFISPAVGIMESFGLIKKNWIPYISIIVISTVLVMVVSGKITQCIMNKNNKKAVE
jgi:holin-like protein